MSIERATGRRSCALLMGTKPVNCCLFTSLTKHLFISKVLPVLIVNIGHSTGVRLQGSPDLPFPWVVRVRLAWIHCQFFLHGVGWEGLALHTLSPNQLLNQDLLLS